MLRGLLRRPSFTAAAASTLATRSLCDNMGLPSVHSLTSTKADGTPLELSSLAGKAIVVVNVASR